MLKYVVFVFLFLTGGNVAFSSAHMSEFEKMARYSSGRLYELGELAYKEGDYGKAEQIFMLICSRYDEDDGRELQYIYAKSFYRTGNSYYRVSSYSVAMDFYLKSQKIAEKYAFNDLLGSIFGHIGNIYASNNDFESAVNFYERALVYAMETDDKKLKSMLTNNLVGANYYKGDLAAVEHYVGVFRDLHFDDARYRYDVALNQSLLFNGKSMNDSARAYALKAIRYVRQDSLSELCMAGANSSIAKYFEDENQLDSALYYLHSNEIIAKNTGSDELLLSTLKDLARMYDKLQMRTKALEYKSEYLAISDSVFSQKEFNTIRNRQVLYELERDASTIKSLNAVRTLQRNGIRILSIAIIVFLVLVIILYLQKRKLKAAWGELYERNRHQLTEEINYKQRIKLLEKMLEESDPSKQQVEVEESSTGGRKLVMHQEQREQIARDILHIMEDTEDYCSNDYSLDKLASSIGSNARYVSEVLNDMFGKSFRTMLNEYRIKKAMIRLNDTEHYGKYTIKAIAESVGYKSQATFISAFMKFTGLKPGIYQKLAVERHDRKGTDVPEV